MNPQQLQSRLQDATTLLGAQTLDLAILRSQLAQVTRERDEAVTELVALKAKPSLPVSPVSTTQQ